MGIRIERIRISHICTFQSFELTIFILCTYVLSFPAEGSSLLKKIHGKYKGNIKRKSVNLIHRFDPLTVCKMEESSRKSISFCRNKLM